VLDEFVCELGRAQRAARGGDLMSNGENAADLLSVLRSIHDDMTDEGMCPYYRRGEEGQDPEGICSFGCRDEPVCQTCWEPPGWPSERLRDLIERVEQVGWVSESGLFYNDWQHEEYDAVPVVPVFRLAPSGRRGRDVKRVEEMFTEEEEKALRQDLHRIHRTAYPEWDLPGMWEQADLTGGWTDCEPPPSGSTEERSNG
jgi:hypothetical protein